jgi:hypothetical protein
MPAVESHIRGAASLTVRVFAISEDYELVVPATTRTVGRPRGQPPGWLQDLLDRGHYCLETIAIIFPSAAGTFRDPSNTSRDIKAALTFAGFDRETSHLLRRCVATQMDDLGIAVREIADQLGHSRPSMTQDVYLGRSRVSTKGVLLSSDSDFRRRIPVALSSELPKAEQVAGLRCVGGLEDQGTVDR